MSGSSSTDVNGISAGTSSDMPDFSNFNLTAVAESGDADMMRLVTCYLTAGENEYDNGLGVRIAALFVIMIVSTAATFFPVLATRVRKLRIPIYVYLFARYFGTGVIVATGFIHLLDPAYDEIGPATCVGMTGGWAEYSWVPALALLSCVTTFFIDFAAERYVEKKYGITHTEVDVEDIVAGRPGHGHVNPHMHDLEHHGHLRGEGVETANDSALTLTATQAAKQKEAGLAAEAMSITSGDTLIAENGFRTQIAAFLVLEFGVLFHSVIIGLALGSAGRSDFNSLFPVLVFHQSFEGLGIGARLSAIPFPSRWNWLPWALCAAYGLTTPLAIAVGLGVRTQYNAGSFTANVISGVLDSLSAGILIYTGLVELLARDFLFDPKRTKDGKRLGFMCGSVLLGMFLMALLGKWA